jgi:hypothetical protein
MCRIKCSNGKYVDKPLWYLITYTNNGKVFHNINLAKKTILVSGFAESSRNEEYSKTYLWWRL